MLLPACGAAGKAGDKLEDGDAEWPEAPIPQPGGNGEPGSGDGDTDGDPGGTGSDPGDGDPGDGDGEPGGDGDGDGEPGSTDPIVLYMSNDDSNSQASPAFVRRMVNEGRVVPAARVLSLLGWDTGQSILLGGHTVTGPNDPTLLTAIGQIRRSTKWSSS